MRRDAAPRRPSQPPHPVVAVRLPRPLPRLRRPAALAPLLLAGACTDPVRPGGSPRPEGQVFVQVLAEGDSAVLWRTDGGPPVTRVAPAGGLVFVNATYHPGRVDGGLRRVTDGRFVVNGVGIPGESRRGDRDRFHHVGDAGAPPADGIVTVTFPAIEGIAPLVLRLSGPAPVRAPAATLAGDELRLRLTPPAERPAPPMFGGSWVVDLSRGARRTSVGGSTALPSELVLPIGTLLPGDGPVTATLSYTVGGSSETQGGPRGETAWASSYTLRSSLRWTASPAGGAR